MLNQQWSNSPRVQSAARALRDGRVVAYPTEGVWGLGCDPNSRQAVQHILEIKDRPESKGLILVADSADRLQGFVEQIPDFPEQTKPTTWLISHDGKTPEWISGGSDKIAVRLTEHPLVAAICACAQMPIVSTSANPSGKPAATSAEQVQEYFGDLIDLIVPGPLGNQNGASQIIDWETKETIRQAGA